MALGQFELYHGAVLAEIVRNPKINLKLIERNTDHGWGAYEVIDNATIHRVFIKSTSQIRKGRKGSCACTFTFSESDIKKLRQIEADRNLLICLVCSDAEICTLEWADIDELRLLFETTVAGVGVYWNKNTSLQCNMQRSKVVTQYSEKQVKDF